MPDGAPPELTAPDAAEAEALAADARMVRSVGRRLVAWAAGTTFLVLVVLAVALYVSVLEHARGERRQTAREADRRHPPRPRGPRDRPATPARRGRAPDRLPVRQRDVRPRPAHRRDGHRSIPAIRTRACPTGCRTRARSTAAVARGKDIRTGTAADTAVRMLTVPMNSEIGTVYVQVFQDRTAEQRTLEGLLAVLLGGGLVVVLVAIGFGAVYSRRALVPIRDSLTAQRGALRRQREFAADASHELRTPLTVIRASVEHLRRHRNEPVAAVGDALDDIGAEVDHLTRLVEELLLLARSDSGAVNLEKLPVDLGDVAADAAGSLAGPARERGVRIEVDPEPVVVTGDAARLRQLVLILVDNAIGHSPRDSTVRVAARRDGPSAVLTVEDEGAGLRSRGPASPLRALLARSRRASRRGGPGPRDRGLDRGRTRRHDRGRQP